MKQEGGDSGRSGGDEATSALRQIAEIVQEHASAGNPQASHLLAAWEAIAGAVPSTEPLKVFPGTLRWSTSVALEKAGLDREARQECAVELDSILRQVAATLPRLVGRRSKTIGGLPVARTGAKQSKFTPAQQWPSECPKLHEECGFLITTTSRHRHMRDAVEEFVTLARVHTPWLLPDEHDEPHRAVFLVRGCTLLLVSGGRGDHGDVSQALHAIQEGMRSAGSSFHHCERVLPFQTICEDAGGAVAAAVRSLNSPLLSENAAPTTFAIRNEGGALHGAPQERKEGLFQIASAVHDSHRVDLRQPGVIIQLRGFEVRGTRWCGVSVFPADLRALPCQPRKDFSHVSCEKPYYRAGVNSRSVAEDPGSVGPQRPRLPSGDALEGWKERLRAAVRRADPSGLWLRRCADAGDVPGGHHHRRPAMGGKKASQRRKRDAGKVQVHALVDAFNANRLLCCATATVEFGAGRGTLTHRVRESMMEPDAETDHDAATERGCRRVVSVLVERDGKLPTWSAKADDSWSNGDDVHLLRIDIRNLWLPGVSDLSGQRVVGIGKHVCGAATDLALKCLCAAGAAPASDEAPAVAGIGIALCCRHVCTWEDYVDQSWVAEAGFQPEDFDIITRMSTWAHGDENEYRQELGLACKDFLDAGRVHFLRRHGFQAAVHEYVADGYTKENRLLVARGYKYEGAESAAGHCERL